MREGGARIEVGSFSTHPLSNTFWITADAVVLSNGTIQMAFNLQHKMFAKKEKLSKEIKAFRNHLWSAFYQDFKLIKPLKFTAIKRGTQE
jgi:hypothetical protein